MAEITEFYIGLSGSDMNEQIHQPQEVIDSIKEIVDAGTFKEGKGLWKGETENVLIFEVADLEDQTPLSMEKLKETLEEEFDQDSIMVKQYDAGVIF